MEKKEIPHEEEKITIQEEESRVDYKKVPLPNPDDIGDLISMNSGLSDNNPKPKPMKKKPKKPRPSSKISSTSKKSKRDHKPMPKPNPGPELPKADFDALLDTSADKNAKEKVDTSDDFRLDSGIELEKNDHVL